MTDEQKGAFANEAENGRESAYLTKQVAEIWTRTRRLNWTGICMADVNDCDLK